jgi:hypothetical protein
VKFRDEITPILLTWRIGWNLRRHGDPRRARNPGTSISLLDRSFVGRSWHLHESEPALKLSVVLFSQSAKAPPEPVTSGYSPPISGTAVSHRQENAGHFGQKRCHQICILNCFGMEYK